MARRGRNNSSVSSGPSPLILNQDRLRAYDQAAAQDDRAQYMEGKQALDAQKFDFQKQREAFAEAQKGSALQQRADQFEQTNQRLTEHGEAMEALKNATLESKQAQIDATAAMQAHKEQETANLAKAATNIFKTFGTLDKTSPDFPQKVWQTLADNPEAVHNPEIMSAVQHQLATHENYLNAQATATKLAAAAAAKQANPNAALEDALAASHPIYGMATSLDPKNFTANTAGTDAQTHVLTTFVTPKGDVKTEVFPRDMFDASVANAQKRAQGVVPPAMAPAAPAPATAVTPVASPAAPVAPPQAHIDYLRQNPNLASDFEAKYGPGSSQQYLTPPPANEP